MKLMLNVIFDKQTSLMATMQLIFLHLTFFFLFSLVLNRDAGTEDVSKNVGRGWTSWRRTIQVKAVCVFFPFTEKQNILDLFILNAVFPSNQITVLDSNISIR